MKVYSRENCTTNVCDSTSYRCLCLAVDRGAKPEVSLPNRSLARIVRSFSLRSKERTVHRLMFYSDIDERHEHLVLVSVRFSQS